MMNDLIDVKIIPITWGNITEDILHLNNIDIIVGSDCFYDKKGSNYLSFKIHHFVVKGVNKLLTKTKRAC